MNTLNGYSKSTLTDNNVLTAAGGHIPLEQLKANSAKILDNYFSTRPTTCDHLFGDGGLRSFKATSSMTTSKPPSDAHVLHFAWNNTGKWESQLALSTSSNPRLFIRSQNGTNWSSWVTLLGTNNYTEYTYSKNDVYTKTESDNKYLPKLRMTNPDPGHASIGAIPFILALKAAGSPLYTDPEFANTNNSVSVYNNSGGGTVTITNIEDNQNSANSSGRILQISTTTGTASPGRGGFYQSMQSRAGAVFVQIFRAKIPEGYTVCNAENSMGKDYKTYWMTERVGTGKWEWYCRVTICGMEKATNSQGELVNFGGGGHVYLERNTSNTPLNVTWYLSYCNTFDLTKGNYDGLRSKYSDSVDWNGVTNKPNMSDYVTIATNQTITGLKTFQNGLTTPLVSSTGRLTLNATSTGVDLKFNNDNAKSVILNGTALKPFDAATGLLDLGTTVARWKGLYTKTGNFTGDISLYASSGDSPRLIFQRGTTTDNTYDWDQYVTGGIFKIRYNPGDATDPNNLKEKWTDVLQMYPNAITTPWNVKIDKGRLQMVGTTATPTWDSPGAITWSENANDGQPVSLVYTSYDSYRSPAGLLLIGNQGNEWFEVKGNIYSNGFVRSGSSNDYVLLGGGGHKTISSLSVSNADTLDGVHANGLLTALSSNTTNAVSVTIGGTTKNITAATLKTNLSLNNVQNTAFYKRSTTVNGTAWDMAGTNSSNAFTIYAPTTAGISGQVLTSTGGTPEWTDQSDLSVSQAKYLLTGTGLSGDTHALALSNYFSANKASILRNRMSSFYSSAYSNGSQYFGYFLSGYNDNPYGGFFVAHYANPYYVGISNGSYTQQNILTSTNYTSYVNTTNFPGLNKTGTVTQVKIGSTAYDPSNGIVSLPAYPTSLPANGGTADGAYYVYDYNSITTPIYIGFANTGLTSTTANYLAAYGTNSAGKRCIKDISAAEAKKFIGLGNVANYNQSKAIKSITRSGLTFTYTCLDGTTGTFSQQDNNTWRGITDDYTGTATNISLSQKGGNDLYTLISGLEDTLTDDFAVSGGGNAWGSSLSVTINGTTKTLTIPSNPNTDTKNTAGSTNTSSKIYLIGATSQAANPQTYSHDTAYVGTDGCLYSNSTKVSVDGHGHSYLKGWSDTRAAATTPNDYNGLFKVVGIKTAGTTLGLTSTQAGSYATIIGWRGWSDSSGGYSWEIASTDKNRLYVRSGSTTSWNNGWNQIAYVSDIPTKTSQLTNDSGFITSRGYLGTTAIQASSAAQAVAGITTLNMSNTLTITGGGMRVTGTAYFGGGTTYYFGSTGNVNCNTLTAASTTILKGSFQLWNSTNSYISFYNNGKTSSNLVAQIHGMAGYNTTSATYTSGTNMYFRIFSSAVNGTTISTAGYYDYIFPNVPQGLTARTAHTIFTTQQSSYTLNGTGGATGDVSLTFWRGSNASWQLLNNGGNLRFKYNYYNNKANDTYKDALVLNYNTGKVCSPTGFYEESDERLKDFYNDVEVDLEKLIQLPKKYFRWKRDPQELNIGTSAQEVQKLYPELVTQNDEGILSVAYDKLSIIALKGIDLLYKEIKELKVRIELLENK